MYFFLFENCHTTPIPVTHRYESVIQVYQTNLIYVLRLCMEILFSPFEVYKVFCSHVHRHLNTYYRNTHGISAYWTNSTHEQVIDVSHTPWYSFWLTSRWHFLNVLCIRKLFKSIIQFVQIRISTLEYHMLSRLLYIHVHCQVFNCILQNFILTNGDRYNIFTTRIQCIQTLNDSWRSYDVIDMCLLFTSQFICVKVLLDTLSPQCVTCPPLISSLIHSIFTNTSVEWLS